MIINELFNITHNQHYVNRYLKFISSIRNKEPRELEYSEKHHILPKSIFPEYSKEAWNIIRLTYREHFIAHLILTKCFYEKDRVKMYFAFNRMLNQKNKNLNRNKLLNSKYYEEKRKSWQINFNKGINHPMFGKKHSDESKIKMSKSRTGSKRTSETKEKMSRSAIGKTFSKEHCKNISKAKEGQIPWNKGKTGLQSFPNRQKMSDEVKEKISKSRTGVKLSEDHKRKISESLTGKIRGSYKN